MTTTSRSHNLVLSRLYFRTGIGVLGFAFPFVLLFGRMLFEGWGMLDSISSYYYSGSMRNVFVGGLVALAILLICYHYERVDTIASTVAGICAIGVANSPTAPDKGATQQQTILGWVHYGFAAVLFIILAYFALVLFRKPVRLFERSSALNLPGRSQQRNLLYWWCGWAIVACILLLLLISRLPNIPWLQPLHPVFWLETLAICAFGFAWIVKGEVLLTDEGADPDPIQYYALKTEKLLFTAFSRLRKLTVNYASRIKRFLLLYLSRIMPK
jgi:hypothetical protein